MTSKPFFKTTLCVFQFIPMPVLYGVFLYMGVASLNGVQVSFISSFSSAKDVFQTTQNFFLYLTCKIKMSKATFKN